MDDKQRKELAGELKLAIVMQEARARELERAERAYDGSKRRTADLVWRLEFGVE